MVSAGTTSIPLLQLFLTLTTCFQRHLWLSLLVRVPALCPLGCPAQALLAKQLCVLPGKFSSPHVRLHHGRENAWNRWGCKLETSNGETQLILKHPDVPRATTMSLCSFSMRCFWQELSGVLSTHISHQLSLTSLCHFQTYPTSDLPCQYPCCVILAHTSVSPV